MMMFAQSLHGISHNKIEDTKEENLELDVTAFDKLAETAMGLEARLLLLPRCQTSFFPVIILDGIRQSALIKSIYE